LILAPGGGGGENVFCNPPYGKEISKWIKKCYEESLKPARTDTRYWHDYIFDKAEIRFFLKGRIKFTDDNGKEYQSAPFPSAVVIWKGAINDQ